MASELSMNNMDTADIVDDMAMDPIFDPTKTKYLLLRKVAMNFGTNIGKNEQEELEVSADGLFFTVKSGKTQVKFGPNKQTCRRLPITEWCEYVSRKICSKWNVVSTEKLDAKEIKKSGEYREIENVSVRDILKELLAAANEVLSEQYSVKIDTIPEKDLTAAQELINKLNTEKDSLSVSEFNKLLMDLWTIIPRPIRQMKNEIVKKQSDFTNKIQAEQELLDFLCSMLRTTGAVDANKTILEANNLEMRDVTKDEENFIKDLMTNNRARYLRAWKCKNHQTEDAFNKYCKSRNLTEENGGITKLWHGSGTPNWWSIFLNGLYLNPELVKADVRICGKMFGYGIYFAPSAGKSIGYTSSRGSYWAQGSDNKAYLAIFKVATGNPYYIYRDGGMCKSPHHWEDFHRDHPDCDCLWAERNNGDNGMRLRNDEVIVYQQCQATIEYLVEFSA